MAIDVLTVGEGAAYARAYGTHTVAGHLLVTKTGPPYTALIALGRGVWDGVDAVYYNAEPLPPEAYHFHPGTPSTGLTDAVQGVDVWLPGGLTYSGRAYIVVQPPGEEPDPGKIIGRYRGLIIADYDGAGNLTGNGFSANPARVAADLMIVAAKLKANRIDWESWKRWRDFCEEAISWDDGTNIQSIPRFTANVAFTQAVTLISALNMICDLSATNWQDDGEVIRFITPNERTPVFDFTPDTFRDGTVAVSQADTEQRNTPNRLTVQFRDIQNDYLAPASWVVEDRAAIDRWGIVDLGGVSYGPMTYSQAQRIGKYLLRVKGSNLTRVEFEGTPESNSVLPGDLITFEDLMLSDTAKTLITLETRDDLANINTRAIVGAVLDGPLYADADHEPIPKAVEVT